MRMSTFPISGGAHEAALIVLGCLLVSLLACNARVAAAAGDWLTRAPEQLPKVTVRWEDADQNQIFIVEGERYQCRVATYPARILSLKVGDTDLLGPDGMELSFIDENGERFVPAPPNTRPKFEVWRRKWVPANDSRARMNVWNATPYYWDAHLLDIPFVSESYVKSVTEIGQAAPMAQWTFDEGDEGWEALHSCTAAAGDGMLSVTSDGDDPYMQSPPLAARGPVFVVLRARSEVGGGAALYWLANDERGFSGDNVVTFSVNGDGDWHEYKVALPVQGTLKRLRFDPPGSSGTTELDWVRINEAPKEDANLPRPVRGEVIFHTYADQLRIELRFEPLDGQAAPKTAVLDGACDMRADSPEGARLLARLGAESAAGLLLPEGGALGTPEGALVAPLTGDRPGAYWVLRPLTPGAEIAAAFAPDLAPLADDAVEVTGGHWLGYDAPSGLYLMDSVANGAGFGFNSAYDTPNRRQAIGVKIRGDDKARRVMVKCASGSGILPSTVLADENGFMLPTPVLSCKNFAGELEEPDDSAYGDAYFPVDLDPGEQTSFQVLHLFQSWGDHMLKQVSSIRFFNIYWHLSTGVSETTCFTIPSMLLNGQFVLIPDYRPYSGPFWPGQPQHHCVSWPGLVQYRSEGQRVHLLYDRTEFESITPNLARFTMHYTTSDGAARVAAKVMEIPHDDEMRTFLRVRYDWDAPVTIDGDARREFKWLNVNDKGIPELAIWTDETGQTQTKPIEAGDREVLLAEKLGGQFPFVGTHGQPGSEGAHSYHSFVLIRSFKARLGGTDYQDTFASAAYDARKGDFWLTVPSEQLELQPGDFVEADLMLMPHAEGVVPELKPERERMRFAESGPKIDSVSVGSKVSDFPAIVEADDEVARFSISGGHSALPVIVKGFKHWSVPLLWQGGLWLNQQAHGGDGYQVNADPDGGYRFTFIIPMRYGMSPELTVTRAECTTGIARVRDLNGYPCLESDEEGQFALKAPVIFAPGRSEVRNGAPAIAFNGQAQKVWAVPVSVAPTGDAALVDIKSYSAARIEMSVDGAARISIGGLARGGQYEVSINGEARTRTATNGTLSVEAAGTSEIAVRKR